MFDSFSTYQTDKPLCLRLGLKPVNGGKLNREYELGDVMGVFEHLRVSVYVEALPAQFWTFMISGNESGILILKTGSGSLEEYWTKIKPLLELVDRGMLTVECVSTLQVAPV